MADHSLARIIRPRLFVSAIALVFAFVFTLSIDIKSAQAAPGGMVYEGVNISGAEWGESNIPGQFMVHYIFPTDSEIDYFANKGMRVIRVPILWERIQPAAMAHWMQHILDVWMLLS